MSVALEHVPIRSNLPIRLGWQWCVEGLRWWWRHPLKFLVMCLLPMLAEGVLQLIPLAGVALSKILPLLLGFGVFSALADSEHTGVLRWASLLDPCRSGRWRGALLLAIWCGPPIFAVQQGIAWLVYSWPAVDAVLLGHVAAHPELQRRSFKWLLILPGFPVATLLGWAPMFWLFTADTPWTAWRRSVRTVLQHPLPFGLYTLIQLAVIALALSFPLGSLLLLPYMPWVAGSSYAVWKTLSGAVPSAPAG